MVYGLEVWRFEPGRRKGFLFSSVFSGFRHFVKETWALFIFGFLRSVQWLSVTDVSRHPIDPMFKRQAVKMGPIIYPEKLVRIYHYTPGKSPQNSSDLGVLLSKTSQGAPDPPPQPPVQRVPYLFRGIKPLNAESNSNCHLLALLGAHHILHVSRIRVKVGGVKL